jgi:hypothetical protein
MTVSYKQIDSICALTKATENLDELSHTLHQEGCNVVVLLYKYEK